MKAEEIDRIVTDTQREATALLNVPGYIMDWNPGFYQELYNRVYNALLVLKLKQQCQPRRIHGHKD